ncbi:PTS system mannose/fructose/sorbose family transporter subunit IID [Lacrimispora sp. 210928-DFI.3.58]|uniref:PTS system mannose/fructose/sorbose family transporter subunit IID n=1 Tax=Lacrimispora sp. 210928-DFI.3.58 TaxID=2883214 RepID=UPI0015B45672|nr:PTS system mannose/fructose/sorbose family transporter subunit IID [Lacrimispora sp. 210928-DFI.3.58]MCB7319300.1 PTS system mannose/fructose/sorbose family transporter subunit IID [Lacrimispora sp. 210928-DFI.3.58]
MASNCLEKKDYIKTSLRAYFLQNGFNYGNYQGLGYANVLYPALRKMYKDDDDKLQEALQENIEFFNTNIHFLPFITSLHLVMLENKTPSKEIRNIKMALMGPLAGIGDSLAQFCLAPLFATIGASLAQEGLIMGPILFLLGMNIVLFIVKILTGMWGYKLGTSIIASLSSRMEQISDVASMIGVTVISGLAVNFVKITTPIQYVANMPGDQQKVVAIQDMINAIAPNLLPVLFTGFIFYLIKVKKWTTYKLVILTVVVGVLLSCLHIIA